MAILAIDYILAHVFVSVGELAEHARATYPTARTAVDKLSGLGILVPFGQSRGKHLWVAQELLDTVYEVHTG